MRARAPSTAARFWPRPRRRSPPSHVSLCACGSSCENDIDKWYDEEFHTDNFEHTTKGSYGPANFQSETVALVFWCHNKITQCQIKIEGITIGESANATQPAGSVRLIEAQRLEA